MIGINLGRFSDYTWWIGDIQIRRKRIWTKNGGWTPFVKVTLAHHKPLNIMGGKPEVIAWNDMKIVRISDVAGFSDWLVGQTLPFVAESKTPLDWAYCWDYERFMKGLPVVD